MKISLEVVNFEQEMRRIEKEVTKIANSQIEKRVDYATVQLGMVTPVDTGEARMGWKNRKEKSFRKRKFMSATIINNVEHISHLNKGHSKQAPKYFIEQVLMTIGLITPT